MTLPAHHHDWATWREIAAQPGIWRRWAEACDAAAIRGWLDGLDVDAVWFCGAGSSAYLGDILASGLVTWRGLPVRSVPTTDIVARPRASLRGRPLVVSFGRSGNSAETVGTLDALDALLPDAPRLNITCNRDSALARRGSAGPQKVVLLPPETHDAGFAMTSSFTTMLLTALAVFGAGPAQMRPAADALTALLPVLETHALAASPPERVVFVGSGPLAFAAREAALKVMELSAGRIPALWDSSLGFRHGPKSFVRGNTAIYVFTSPDSEAARYDADLIAELRRQFPAATITAMGPGGDIDPRSDLPPVWGAALAVVLAQVLGVVWSAALGLNVDDPFAGQGTLSRVVSGVTLYPVAS